MTTSRRKFLHTFTAGTLTIPLVAIGYPVLTMAADRPKVDPQDDAAQALGYVHAAPNPSKKCSDCQLFKGSGRAEWSACGVFAGKLVNARGWCSAWSA